MQSIFNSLWNDIKLHVDSFRPFLYQKSFIQEQIILLFLKLELHYTFTGNDYFLWNGLPLQKLSLSSFLTAIETFGYKNPGKYCTGYCIYKLIFWDRPPSWKWQKIIKPIRCQLGNNWQQQSKWWLSKRFSKIYFCINEVNINITYRGLTPRCPQNMLDIVNEYSKKWRINLMS